MPAASSPALPSGDEAPGRLPSSLDLATANRGRRNFPEQWHSPALLDAWRNVVGVMFSSPFTDRRTFIEIADRIEAADIALGEAEGQAGS